MKTGRVMYMKEDEKRERILWEEEDWDKVSVIHKWHRTILGYPMTTEVLVFYIIIVLFTVFSTLLFNF